MRPIISSWFSMAMVAPSSSQVQPYGPCWPFCGYVGAILGFGHFGPMLTVYGIILGVVFFLHVKAKT